MCPQFGIGILSRFSIISSLVGCGGYVFGDGVVSSPDYLPNAKVVECVWYLEAHQSDLVVYMKVNLNVTSPMILSSNNTIPTLLPALKVLPHFICASVNYYLWCFSLWTRYHI